jgi:hypothetical protein
MNITQIQHSRRILDYFFIVKKSVSILDELEFSKFKFYIIQFKKQMYLHVEAK